MNEIQHTFNIIIITMIGIGIIAIGVIIAINIIHNRRKV